jgi:hypothetical protein
VGPVIRLIGAELRRLLQPRSGRLLLAVCVALVATVLALEAGRARPVSLVHDLRGGLTGVGTALVFVAVAAGASAVARDLASGALVTLLTWEPRRARVVLGKSLAAGAGATVVALGVAVALVAGLALSSLLGGDDRAVEGAWVVARAGQLGSLLLGIAAAGFVGAALTFVTRSTALSISLFLLLALLGERALDEVAPGSAEWAPAGLILHAASGGAGLFRLEVAAGTAAWRTLAAVGVIGLVAVVVFRRRDPRGAAS